MAGRSARYFRLTAGRLPLFAAGFFAATLRAGGFAVFRPPAFAGARDAGFFAPPAFFTPLAFFTPPAFFVPPAFVARLAAVALFEPAALPPAFPPPACDVSPAGRAAGGACDLAGGIGAFAGGVGGAAAGGAARTGADGGACTGGLGA